MRKALAASLALLALAATLAAQQPQPVYKPKSPDDKARSESEFKSIAFMKTVLANEKEYRKKRGGYAPSLYALAGGGRSFTRRMARTDRGDYTVAYRGGREGFSLTLTPKEFAPDRRAFYMDSSGVIRVEEDKPATRESPVLE